MSGRRVTRKPIESFLAEAKDTSMQNDDGYEYISSITTLGRKANNLSFYA